MANPPSTHQKVGWFELFYDLVIVAVVGYAAHTFAEHPSWALGFWIAAWTFIMFVLWLMTSLLNNLQPGDHPGRRLLMLVQMLALVLAALGTVADEGLSNATGFVGLAAAFASVAAMFAIAAVRRPADVQGARVLGWTAGAGALVLLLGVFLPDDADWTLAGAPPWLLAIGVGLSAVPLFGLVVARVAPRIDREHLAERLGQLVIIVLGESFLSLVSALGGQPSIPNPLFFVLTFAVVFGIWTIYFSSVLPAGVPVTAGTLRAWLLTHWLLMFGAVGAAAGFSAVTLVPFGAARPEAASEWTTLPLAFVLLSLSVLTRLGARSWTRLARAHLVAAGVLLVLAVIGIFATAAGESWEIALGSAVVIIDAGLCARWERPYARRPAPAA